MACIAAVYILLSYIVMALKVMARIQVLASARMRWRSSRRNERGADVPAWVQAGPIGNVRHACVPILRTCVVPCAPMGILVMA